MFVFDFLSLQAPNTAHLFKRGWTVKMCVPVTPLHYKRMKAQQTWTSKDYFLLRECEPGFLQLKRRQRKWIILFRAWIYISYTVFSLSIKKVSLKEWLTFLGNALCCFYRGLSAEIFLVFAGCLTTSRCWQKLQEVTAPCQEIVRDVRCCKIDINTDKRFIGLYFLVADIYTLWYMFAKKLQEITLNNVQLALPLHSLRW